MRGGRFADDPSQDPDRPSGAGPVFLGGFAFAHEGGRAPEWASLAPAQLILPEVSFARGRGEARMTVTVAVDPPGASLPTGWDRANAAHGREPARTAPGDGRAGAAHRAVAMSP